MADVAAQEPLLDVKVAEASKLYKFYLAQEKKSKHERTARAEERRRYGVLCG
jgi:hypothetical protein